MLDSVRQVMRVYWHWPTRQDANYDTPICNMAGRAYLVNGELKVRAIILPVAQSKSNDSAENQCVTALQIRQVLAWIDDAHCEQHSGINCRTLVVIEVVLQGFTSSTALFTFRASL